MGPLTFEGEEDADVIKGKQTITTMPGASFLEIKQSSFYLIRKSATLVSVRSYGSC